MRQEIQVEIESLRADRIALGECAAREEVGIQTPWEIHQWKGECPVVGRWRAYWYSALLGSSRNPSYFTLRVLQSENSFSGSQHFLDKRVIFPARMDPWLFTSSILSHISHQAANCQTPLPSLQARQSLQGVLGSDYFCPPPSSQSGVF